MPKFITGIIAILCLHLGYVAYLASEQQEIAVNKAGTETFPVADMTADLTEAVLPTENELIFAAAKPDYIRRPQKIAETAPVFARTSKRTVSRPKDYSTTEAYAVRRPLQVIVTDPYADMPSDEHGPIRADMARKESKAGGKSFAAKALPIVKKPYEWIRSLGSKLR